MCPEEPRARERAGGAHVIHWVPGLEGNVRLKRHMRRRQVGRTGRAGAAGRVTSLYGPAQAALAEALRAAVEAGEPVEGAFSRKRSFAKKLKRYGRYVPRGHTVE